MIHGLVTRSVRSVPCFTCAWQNQTTLQAAHMIEKLCGKEGRMLGQICPEIELKVKKFILLSPGHPHVGRLIELIVM